MDIRYEEVMHRINCLASDLDALYHRAAVKFGLSDSVLMILYFIYEKGGCCPLNTVRKESCLNKQTLNSAIRKLEGEGVVRLESSGGKTKNVYLTEHGKEYAKTTVARLFDAESHVFRDWTEEEIRQYLFLMEKYNSDFRRRIERL